ncbi:MAG: hypothetical protein ACLFM4_00015 [Phormidium sp.]
MLIIEESSSSRQVWGRSPVSSCGTSPRSSTMREHQKIVAH